MRNPLAIFPVLSLLWAIAPASGAEPPSRRLPDFELPEVKVARADLERLPGSYVNQEMGMALKVDLQGDGLRISILEGPRFPPARLIPTSPTRFRWEGDGMAPGLTVVFHLKEGKATELAVVQPNKPAEVVLKRSERGLQGLLGQPFFVLVLVVLVVLGLLSYRGTAAIRRARAQTRDDHLKLRRPSPAEE